MKYRKILFSALAPFFFVGCLAFQVKELPPEEEIVAFKPLKLEMAYDLYHIRLDIQRQTTTTTTTQTDSKGITRTTTQTVDVPYHYIGVDLGNGLFLDARLNLSINLVKFFELEELDYFKVTYSSSGMFEPQTVFEKDGNQASRKVMALFGEEAHVTLTAAGARIRGGFLQSDQDITVGDNEITYDPHTILGDWTITRILRSGRGLRIPNFWRDFEMTLNEDGSVSLGDNLRISPEGKKLILEFSGIFGFKKRYTFVRTDSHFYYYDENGYGFMAEIGSDEVRVKYGLSEKRFRIQRNRQ